MMQQSGNNQRIFRNTLMLYMRMIFNLFVSFYTSRVILDVLGVTDFGINNVVAGVAGLFTFFNSSLAGATSRFITYNLGLGDLDKLRKTFSAALTVHLFLSLLIFILCETVGLWLLENKLVIPEERMNAARMIYQFAVFSSMLSITQVPYNACIIAHEKMDIFAYFGIIEVLLKLLIVFVLQWFSVDKLVLYGFLFMLLSLCLMLAYRWYGYSHFQECRFKLIFDKSYIQPMLCFSGWDLYGNMAIMLRSQGINILQNMFFGPVINAATGIANQAAGALLGFSRSFMTAIEPQIVKYYAQEELEEMQKLTIQGAKFSFYMFAVFSFPFILRINDVMDIWLSEVPDYSYSFFRLVIISNWIWVMMQPLSYVIHATGRLKHISLVSGSLFLLSLPLTYLFLKLGGSPLTPFVIGIIICASVYCSNLMIVKHYIPSFKVLNYLKKVSFQPLMVVLLGAILPFCLNSYLSDSFFTMIVVFLISYLSLGLAVYYWGLSLSERLSIHSMIKRIFH